MGWPLIGVALCACGGVLDLSGSLSVRCLWSAGGSRLVFLFLGAAPDSHTVL